MHGIISEINSSYLRKITFMNLVPEFPELGVKRLSKHKRITGTGMSYLLQCDIKLHFQIRHVPCMECKRGIVSPDLPGNKKKFNAKIKSVVFLPRRE